MIGIVDYGMGNLRSVEKALNALGESALLITDAAALSDVDKLIVPGVGAFGDAMRELNARNLVKPLQDYAGAGKPLLGICLGMQAFFESSEEAPGVEGLGLLAGTVRRFDLAGMKVPHMGWNQAMSRNKARLMSGLSGEKSGSDPTVYFVHSYYVCPANNSAVAAVTDYGISFASAVEEGNVMGTQFHPEKSQSAGLALLKNFIDL
jgi:glutamine amidotransferase